MSSSVLISSSGTYLAIFSLGAVIGASSAYLVLGKKFKVFDSKPPQEELFEFPDPKDEYRLVMAIRNDLKMQKGKVAAQCGHAAVAAYAKALNSRPKTLKRWMSFGGTKITVRLESEKELLEIQKAAHAAGILASVVRDAGQTQVAPGSRTVIAIGPAPKSALEKITDEIQNEHQEWDEEASAEFDGPSTQ